MSPALYCFQVASPVDEATAVRRLRALARAEPSWRDRFSESMKPRLRGSPPFIGEVHGSRFAFRRDITYRNSFLPRIEGSVGTSPSGWAEISVRMHLHPISLFVVLGIVAALCIGATAALFGAEGAWPWWTCVLTTCALAGIAGSFYSEAFTARRLLEAGVSTLETPASAAR